MMRLKMFFMNRTEWVIGSWGCALPESIGKADDDENDCDCEDES
jgi:hypothetical protein